MPIWLLLAGDYLSAFIKAGAISRWPAASCSSA